MANNKAFLDGLTALREQLRRTIDAEVDGFDIDPTASAARRLSGLVEVRGYELLVQTYFPHYIRSPHRSALRG